MKKDHLREAFDNMKYEGRNERRKELLASTRAEIYEECADKVLVAIERIEVDSKMVPPEIDGSK